MIDSARKGGNIWTRATPLKGVTIAVTLAIYTAGAQPIFVERMVYQRPQPTVMEPTGRVAELIKKLSDESSEKRQLAARELLKMGPTVERQLRWARQHGESGGKALSWNMHHVREGNKWVQDARYLRPWHTENELDVLISHLEEQRRSPASIITLHHKDAPLTNVLRDLGMQADADVAVGGWYFLPESINTARATIDVDGVNFWEALQAIQKSTGLGPKHINAQNRLVLTDRFSNAEPNVAGGVVSGALQIVPIGARARSSDNEAGSPWVTVILQAFAEAKLSDTGPHAMVRIEECVDDKGQSLIAGGKGKFKSLGADAWRWTVALLELGPLETGRWIKRMKGEFSVGIGPVDRYMTITNVLQAQGKAREFDGLKVAVKEVTAIGAQHRIDVEVLAPKDSPYTRTFSASSELEVWVWDESRQTIVSEKVFNGVRREAERDIASWSLITPKASPRPATLVWKTPAETRWHTAPFELKDIAVR